jgi:hypothetical protein
MALVEIGLGRYAGKANRELGEIFFYPPLTDYLKCVEDAFRLRSYLRNDVTSFTLRVIGGLSNSRLIETAQRGATALEEVGQIVLLHEGIVPLQSTDSDRLSLVNLINANIISQDQH